jgi:hypothetical protein
MTILVTNNQLKVSVLDTVKQLACGLPYSKLTTAVKTPISVALLPVVFLLRIQDLLVLGQGSLITGKYRTRWWAPLMAIQSLQFCEKWQFGVFYGFSTVFSIVESTVKTSENLGTHERKITNLCCNLRGPLACAAGKKNLTHDDSQLAPFEIAHFGTKADATTCA